jgi:hypothetical protein
VVRTIRLASLTLLAESKLAVTLDRKGGALRSILCRKESVTHIVRRRAGRCKDSGSVAPVEHDVKYNAYYRGTGACKVVRWKQQHRRSPDVPIQLLFLLALPIHTTTQTAHDVRLYTKASGKYVAKVQQQRSTLRAHLRAVAIAPAYISSP